MNVKVRKERLRKNRQEISRDKQGVLSTENYWGVTKKQLRRLAEANHEKSLNS